MPGAQKKGQPRVVGLYIGGGVLAQREPVATTVAALRGNLEISERSVGNRTLPADARCTLPVNQMPAAARRELHPQGQAAPDGFRCWVQHD